MTSPCAHPSIYLSNLLRPSVHPQSLPSSIHLIHPSHHPTVHPLIPSSFKPISHSFQLFILSIYPFIHLLLSHPIALTSGDIVALQKIRWMYPTCRESRVFLMCSVTHMPITNNGLAKSHKFEHIFHPIFYSHLYYASNGAVSQRIGRIDMDGNNKVTVLQFSYGYISGLTIEHLNADRIRLYYTQNVPVGEVYFIEIGTNYSVPFVTQEVNYPVDLTTLGSKLYLTDLGGSGAWDGGIYSAVLGDPNNFTKIIDRMKNAWDIDAYDLDAVGPAGKMLSWRPRNRHSDLFWVLTKLTASHETVEHWVVNHWKKRSSIWSFKRFEGFTILISHRQARFFKRPNVNRWKSKTEHTAKTYKLSPPLAQKHLHAALVFKQRLLIISYLRRGSFLMN